MYQTKKVFDKYQDAIVRKQFKNFHPLSTLMLNAENKKTTFKIDLSDEFICKDVKYYISGKYVSTDSTKPYKSENKDVRLVDNFVANLFSNIEVEKHDVVVDKIENPGIASTVQGYVCQNPKNCNGNAISSGFNSKAIGGGNFSAVGYLGDLGLGFFKDLTVPIYKGGFTITFTRNSDDNVIFRSKKDTSTPLPPDGKIEITSFFLRVPVIEYENESKVNLITDLRKIPYQLQFKSWQCIPHRNVSGKNLMLDVTNIYNKVYSPLWCFIVFQTDVLNDQTKDNAKFVHKDVRNYWLVVDGKRYPQENYDLDFDENDFYLAYDAYLDFKKLTNSQDNSPFMNEPEVFKRDYPIFSIDLTDQPKSISGGISNIILHVEFNKTVSAPSGSSEGTTCYVILVSGSSFVYNPVKNTIEKELV